MLLGPAGSNATIHKKTTTTTGVGPPMGVLPVGVRLWKLAHVRPGLLPTAKIFGSSRRFRGPGALRGGVHIRGLFASGFFGSSGFAGSTDIFVVVVVVVVVVAAAAAAAAAGAAAAVVVVVVVVGVVVGPASAARLEFRRAASEPPSRPENREVGRAVARGHPRGLKQGGEAEKEGNEEGEGGGEEGNEEGGRVRTDGTGEG